MNGCSKLRRVLLLWAVWKPAVLLKDGLVVTNGLRRKCEGAEVWVNVGAMRKDVIHLSLLDSLQSRQS